MCNYPTSLSLQVSTNLHVEFSKHVPRHPTGDRLNQRTDTGSEEAKSARNLRKNFPIIIRGRDGIHKPLSLSEYNT
jgi:hypothetical protein